MAIGQSGNIIQNIHRLITSEHGENYWFNGCAAYVMESLGEKDYDYQFFAGLTGDVFTQHYSRTPFPGDGVNAYRQAQGDTGFFENVFAKCGYAAKFVTSKELRENSEKYIQALTLSVDRGVPVITLGQGGPPFGVYVGYEEHGGTLLYISGDSGNPERVSLETALSGADTSGLIFVGDKKENRVLADLYREAIYAIPALSRERGSDYFFGAEAFRAWADDIEGGRYDAYSAEDFQPWPMYTNFICVLATNGSCCHDFLNRARELNPDMDYLTEISRLYRRIAEMWGGDNNRNDADSLEALGGGFNVSLEILQDRERRCKITAKLREFAAVTDEIMRILTEKTASENMRCQSFKYIKLGEVRFIGIDAWRTGEGWDALWERSGEFMPALNDLAADYGTDIEFECSMMHHNGHEVDSENHFLAGRFFKAGTPVPEGYDSFDVPTEYAAYAVYETGSYDGSVGSAYYAVRDRILADSVGIPYPHAYWHAEVYTDDRPRMGGAHRFGYLFSVDGGAVGKQ